MTENQMPTPPYQASEVRATGEYQRASVALEIFDQLRAIYGDEVADNPEFKQVVSAAVKSAEMSARGKEAIHKLAEKIKSVGSGAPEGSAESQGLREAADTDHDGKISVEEARQAVARFFREAGLDDQAELFLAGRKNKQ